MPCRQAPPVAAAPTPATTPTPPTLDRRESGASTRSTRSAGSPAPAARYPTTAETAPRSSSPPTTTACASRSAPAGWRVVYVWDEDKKDFSHVPLAGWLLQVKDGSDRDALERRTVPAVHDWQEIGM